jgi:hypothetical protein
MHGITPHLQCFNDPRRIIIVKDLVLHLVCSLPTSILLSMASDSSPPKRGGLSLYANLLDPSSNTSPGTISRAPVVFKQASEGDSQTDDSAAKKQQLSAGRPHTLLS